MKKIKSFVAYLLLAVMCLLEPGAAFAATAKSKPQSKEQIPLSELTLSLSFENKPLGQVLATVARLTQASLKNGANFALSPQASNSLVTTEFEFVKFRDALDIIAKAANVSITEEKPNLFIVRTQMEMDQVDPDMSEKQKELKAVERRISNGIIRTFVLNYVGAQDVQEALDELFEDESESVFSISVLGSNGSSSSSTMATEREYSTVIVFASNERVMRYIENIIEELDRPRPMVEVEAVFVEISTNRDSDFGLTWDILPSPIEMVEETIGSVGVSDLTSEIPIFNRWGLGSFKRTSGASTSTSASFLESNSKGKVLSNPRIRVMSGHTAGFSSETQVPIMNKDGDGEVTTEYKNVGISLDILPIVLNNDQIYLTVKPSVASITDTVTMGDTQAPQIDERSAETTVLMRDNEIMVIGGLLSDRDIKSMSKVPILWKIPLLGELFKSTTTEKAHSSLSVYIRLRLIRDYMDDAVSHLSEGNKGNELVQAGRVKFSGESMRQTPKDRDADAEKISTDKIDVLLEGLKKREDEEKQKKEAAKKAAKEAQETKEKEAEAKAEAARKAMQEAEEARIAAEKARAEAEEAERQAEIGRYLY